MVHKLALVAISGITISAVCFGAGGALEGKDFGRDFGGGDFSFFDSRPRCDAVSAGNNITSRELDWDGSDHISLTAPGQATYTPGTDARLHVSGDARLVSHVRVRDGKVELDCRGWHSGDNLTIALPGREFNKFAIAGSGHLILDKLNQTEVTLAIGGSGHIQANGKLSDLKLAVGGSGDMDLDQITADHGTLSIGGSGTVRAKGAIQELEIKIGGSGRADFGKVASRIATVRIGGHGDVDIAPTDEANIRIGGSGDVTLHSEPKQLDTHIGGSGRIHHLAGSAT
jgi:hypothetical protein